MARLFEEQSKMTKLLKIGTGSGWRFPNIYQDEKGNICYDIVSQGRSIRWLKEFNEYIELNKFALDIIRERYKNTIASLYKAKLNNLTYSTAYSLKLANKARSGQIIKKSALSPAFDRISDDDITLGYIVNSLRNFEFKPYKQIAEIMMSGVRSNSDKSRYLFPIFTENGIKTELVGKNLETCFELITEEEALALQEELKKYTEQIPTGYRLDKNELKREIKYENYSELVDKLFNSAKLAGRAIQSQILPVELEFAYNKSTDQLILKHELRNMEALSIMMFAPDTTKMIKTPRKPSLVSSSLTVDTNPSPESNTLSQIVIDGGYNATPKIDGNRIVSVITPSGAEYFKYSHDGNTLNLSQEQDGKQNS